MKNILNNIENVIEKMVIIFSVVFYITYSSSGAGHIAGGTASGIFKGQGFSMAFNNSFEGLGQSMAMGAGIGVASTIGVSYANGINPINGKHFRTETTVYRAVDAREASIIRNTGEFSLQDGGVEVKYFAKSVEDANWYGQRLYPEGYSIIKGNVIGPINANQFWYPNIDIGAYVFPKTALPYIIPHY